jgi:hypothetical protein
MDIKSHTSSMRPVADRTIEMKSFEETEGILIMEGVLMDDRHMEFSRFSGEAVPAGRFHTLKARMSVRVATMRIEDIEIDFQDYPHHECPELKEKYRSLIGLHIESGFTRAVLERVGGAKACAHLTHLIITMGPAFVQAAFTYQTRTKKPTPPSREQVRSYFIDSCWVWRADGPHAKEHG